MRFDCSGMGSYQNEFRRINPYLLTSIIVGFFTATLWAPMSLQNDLVLPTTCDQENIPNLNVFASQNRHLTNIYPLFLQQFFSTCRFSFHCPNIKAYDVLQQRLINEIDFTSMSSKISLKEMKSTHYLPLDHLKLTKK